MIKGKYKTYTDAYMACVSGELEIPDNLKPAWDRIHQDPLKMLKLVEELFDADDKLANGSRRHKARHKVRRGIGSY